MEITFLILLTLTDAQNRQKKLFSHVDLLLKKNSLLRLLQLMWHFIFLLLKMQPKYPGKTCNK